MCWSCNPYCGGCKPPKPKPIKCPSCGIYSFKDLKNCERCGAVMPERESPPTVMCLYIGQLCANPCQKHKKMPEDGTQGTCSWHTKPKTET